jgi:hypothetical protein
MAALNLHYEAPELATQIYRATAGRANLMTTACDEIIKSLTWRERVISSSLVHKVLHGFELRGQLEGWSDLTHNGNDAGISRATRLDRIVVYSILLYYIIFYCACGRIHVHRCPALHRRCEA